MKRSAKIICALFVIIMLASCVVMGISASSAYQTYTYSISGYALYSPDAYTADPNIITYKQMGEGCCFCCSLRCSWCCRCYPCNY